MGRHRLVVLEPLKRSTTSLVWMMWPTQRLPRRASSPNVVACSPSMVASREPQSSPSRGVQSNAPPCRAHPRSDRWVWTKI